MNIGVFGGAFDPPHLGHLDDAKRAFDQLGLERVFLNVLADNPRARRFYEKAGFQYEGCFRHHLLLKDGWHDWVWMAILKEDYERRTD